MRCQKCGFISFDHLAECKKCGVDLTATRKSLGLLNLKPSVPFFLNSMLSEQSTQPASQREASGIETFETDLPDIEFGEDLSFDIEMPVPGEIKDDSAQAGGKKSAGDYEDSSVDFFKDLEKELTIELSEEDLQRSLQEIEPRKGLELEIDLALDEPSAAAIDTAPEHHEDNSDLSEFMISDEDLDGLILDAELERSPKVRVEKTDAEPQYSESERAPERAGQIRGSADEHLVIELAEDDLENLLMELDEISPDKESRSKTTEQEAARVPGTKRETS